MQRLATYILKGPTQAITVVVVAAMLSFLAPPFTSVIGYLGGAALALITLHIGISQGLIVLLGSLVGLSVIAYIVFRAIGIAVILLFFFWMPVWMVAVVLRSSRSLALSIQSAAFLGMIGVFITYLVLQDPVSMWIEQLAVIKPLLAQGYAITDDQQVEKIIATAAAVMTGSTIAFLLIGVVLSLMIARSWQAGVSNPGAFAKEFQQLRFDKITWVLSMMVFVAALLFRLPIMINVAIVIAAAYLFYGLAVVHGLVNKVNAGTVSLVVLYAMLFVISELVVPVLVVLALSDTWFDYRARVAPRANSS